MTWVIREAALCFHGVSDALLVRVGLLGNAYGHTLTFYRELERVKGSELLYKLFLKNMLQS